MKSRFGLSVKQDGGYFYFLILIVSLAFSLSIGTIRAFSVFLPIWQHEFEIDLFGVSAIYYFYFAGSMVNVLLAPIILKYCHSRVMMIIAAVGSSASWALAFLAKDMFTTQLLLGFFLSYFQNMFFYCSNVVFQSWMNKKRVFGNATVFCGVPLGAMVLSPLWVMLIEKFSWRGCCLIQAGIALQLLWLALLIIECPSNKIDTERKPFSWGLLKMPQIWTFSLGCSLYYAAYSVLNLFVSFTNEVMGENLTKSALIISLQTAVEVVFRPIFGYAISKFETPNNTLLFALAATLLAISLFLFYFATSWTLLIIFSVIQGIAFAFCGGLPTAVICEIAGWQRLPTAFVIFTIAIDTSFVIGPILYSYLARLYTTKVMFIASPIVASLSIVLICITNSLQKR